MAASTTAERTIDVVTPAAGESVTEGTILEWHVKVGEFIKVDDTIVEISTDKVDVELPSPASGTVSEILVAGGRHRHGRPGDRPHCARRCSPHGRNGGRRPDEGRGWTGPDDRWRGAGRERRQRRAGGGGLEPADGAAGRGEDAGFVDVVTPAAGESVSRGNDPRMARRRSATDQGRTTRSSTSPPTRSTSSFPRPASGTVAEVRSSPRETRSRSGR